MNIHIWCSEYDDSWSQQIKTAIENEEPSAIVKISRLDRTQRWPKADKDETVLLLVSDALSAYIQETPALMASPPGHVHLVIHRVNHSPIPPPLQGRIQITLGSKSVTTDEVKQMLDKSEPWTPSSFDELKLKIVFKTFYRIEKILSRLKGTQKVLAITGLSVIALTICFFSLRAAFGRNFLTTFYSTLFHTKVTIEAFEFRDPTGTDKRNYISNIEKYKNLTIRAKVQNPGHLMIFYRTANKSACLNCKDDLPPWVEKQVEIDSIESSLPSTNGEIILYALASKSEFNFSSIQKNFGKFPSSSRSISKNSPYFLNIPGNEGEYKFDQRLIRIHSPKPGFKPALQISIKTPGSYELGKILRTCAKSPIAFNITTKNELNGMLFYQALHSDTTKNTLLQPFPDNHKPIKLPTGNLKEFKSTKIGPDTEDNKRLIGYAFVLISHEKSFQYQAIENYLKHHSIDPKSIHGPDLLKSTSILLPEEYQQDWAYVMFDPPCESGKSE